MFPVVTVTLAAVCALPSPAELVLQTFLETFESCLHIQHRFASVELATEGKKTSSGYSLFFMNHFHHALNLEFF